MDVEAVARVLRSSFVGYRPLYTPAAFEQTAIAPERVLQRLGQGPIWIAWVGADAVGTVSSVVTSDGCHVRGMGVMTGARRRGIGWLLLEELEAFARSERLPQLDLSTTPFLSRAIRLYERFGFHRIDGGPADFFGTPIFSMVKPLAR